LSQREDPSATVTGIGAAHDLAPGTLLAGRFRIDGLIGVGGMGVVYRAHDLDLDVALALKLLRPEFARRPEALERFRRELLLARQVSSPRVVRIHDIGQHQGLTFITMDLVPGESLERLIEREGPMAPERAIAIARQLCEGLAAAHARNVVHRDLKPANILVTPEGEALITDFGVARSISASGMTEAGVIVGTPEYLSPEQARGEAVDGRSDLYALGLMLFEMLSGRLPFAGGTPAERLGQRLLRPPPSLTSLRPGLPTWLVALCARLLRPRPSQRLPTAEAVIEAIDRRRVPREPLAWGRLAASAAAVLLFGLGIAWLLTRPPELLAPSSEAPSRLILLPVTGTIGAAEARALDEHLAAWLRSDSGLALADPERTRTLLLQLGYGTEAALRNLDRVREAASGQRVLALTIERGAEDAQAAVELHDTVGSTRSDHSASNIIAAYRAASEDLWTLLERPPPPAPAWARDDATLAALGEALLALDGGEAEVAATGLGQAGAAMPLAQLRRIQALDATGAVAEAAALAGQAHAGAGARLASEFALWAAELAGDETAYLDRLRAQVEAFPLDLRYRMQLGEALGEAGERGAAEIELLKVVADDPAWARAWFLLGKYAILRGEARRAAEEYLLRAQLLYTRSGELAGQAETTNALGAALQRLGQTEEALNHYRRAAELRGRLGDHRGQAASLRNLANLQSVTGDFEGAEASLRRAGEILETIRDRPGLANLYNNLGILEEERGDYPRALDAYRQALALRQELGDVRGVAESLNNVGFAFHQLGEADNALVYWRQAAQAYESIEDPAGRARVQQSLALLQIGLGDWQSADQYLDASLLTAEDLGLREELAAGLVLKAELARLRGRFAASLAAAERAAELFTQRDDARGRVEAGLQGARTALALGADTQARAYLERIQEDGDIGLEQRAAVALIAARLAAREDDTAQVDRLLASVAEQAAQSGRPSLAAEARLETLRLGLAAGSDVAAQAQALTEEVRRLGQFWLELAAAELALAADLAQGRESRAVERYRELEQRLLRLGDYQRAAHVHALGARALRADAAAAARAAASSREASEALTGAAPADLRALLELELQRDIAHAHPDP
jgi:eukaryotic-like serine/threonine-protein kinase